MYDFPNLYLTVVQLHYYECIRKSMEAYVCLHACFFNQIRRVVGIVCDVIQQTALTLEIWTFFS